MSLSIHCLAPNKNRTLIKAILIMILTMQLLLLATIPAGATAPRIMPLHTRAEFSRSSSAKEWSAWVLTSGGRRAYKLFFEREYSANRALVGVDLVLNDTRNLGPEANLLSPPRNWHGMQAYMFVASDFVQGFAKSVFGSRRTIKLNDRGIVVQIDVLNVGVSPVPGGDHQIDDVQLSVTVDNTNP